MQFAWNVDLLRTMFHALVTSYAVVCLTQGRYGPVIADEVDPACLSVVLVLL